MAYNEIKGNEINGNLDIFISQKEDENEGIKLTWSEVLIHGDPDGLRSLAELLLEIADLNQELVEDKNLLLGAREHYHLTPGIELSKSSVPVIVDALMQKELTNFIPDTSQNKIIIKYLNKNLPRLTSIFTIKR